MTEIRAGLNRRLEELRGRLEFDKDNLLKYGPEDHMYLHAQRNISELREVEAILATMQLADAQLQVAKAQREDTEARSKKASTAEEFSFWSRRFLTTTTVAHAVGLVSTLAFLTKKDSPRVPVEDVEKVLECFLAGLLLGGSYPLMMMLWVWLSLDAAKDFLLRSGTLILWPAFTTLLLLAAIAHVSGVALGIAAAR